METELFGTLEPALGHLNDQDIQEIRSAYDFSEKAHRGQMRDTGEAYITHPVAVANIMALMRLDKESIMAGLLHDVIEDTGVDKKTLAKLFGRHVADLVDGVSKLTKIESLSSAEAEAENFQKMLMAMVQDIRVILVKLADRLHNMRTLEPLPFPKRRRVAKETLEIFAPIAKRLGMRTVSDELEDLGFLCLYPFRYRVLKTALARAHGSRKQVLKEIDATFSAVLNKSKLTNYHMHSREKNLYSIYKKMVAKKITFAELTDVYAIRIITPEIDDCYHTLGLVHQIYKPMPDGFTDYIALPKTNGYQSIHTLLFGPYGVPIEVQIRTERMHEVATVGVAAHAMYKAGHKNEKHNQPQLKVNQWLEKLKDIHTYTLTPIEFAEHVKIDLFPDEVYIFTPKGDIFELPCGSTVVDFAYAIHTEIGARCISATVDRRPVSVSTELMNGQTVEIITDPKASPDPAWLDFLVTGKARNAVKHFIKSRKDKTAQALGKNLLKQAAKNCGISWRKIPPLPWKNLLHSLKLNNTLDLYKEVGLGNHAPLIIMQRLTSILTQNTRKPIEPVAEPPQLMIRGTEGMVVEFASCCCPIPGDPILGELNVGQGIRIHVESCKQAMDLRTLKNKSTRVRWADTMVGNFLVAVYAEIKNQEGALAALTCAIADAHSNIESIEVLHHQRNQIMLKLLLSVKHRDHLAQIMRNTRTSSSLIRIDRVHDS